MFCLIGIGLGVFASRFVVVAIACSASRVLASFLRSMAAEGAAAVVVSFLKEVAAHYESSSKDDPWYNVVAGVLVEQGFECVGDLVDGKIDMLKQVCT